MVLRVRFTSEDLCRLRVAPGPHPTWEMILSINSLLSPRLPAAHWGWRDTVVKVARRDLAHQRSLVAATALVPAAGDFPDFLTPAIVDTDVDAHFDAILAQPKQSVRDDLQRTFAHTGAAPRWARALYRDSRTNRLVDVLRRYHQLALRQGWRDVHRHVEADRARYARLLLTGGVDQLLHGLHPSIRWRNPILEADYPDDHTIDLAGRGLTLVPAHFCWGAPITFIDTTNAPQPMLVCPTNRDAPAAPADPNTTEARVDRLGALLGHTRARLLSELSIADSTTRLAIRLAVTPAAVSQHTAVLRQAGLLTTTRIGQAVRHALTPLGRALLEG